MNTMFSDSQTQLPKDFGRQPFESAVVPEIPQPILTSPLMRRGGFDIFSGIADEAVKNSLLAEAITQQEVMTESTVAVEDAEEIRGGAPRRRFTSSAGGELQRAFYHSEWLLGFLRDQTLPFLQPTGPYGTFSYYSRTGDFLEIHRDISACDVAVITCLENRFGTDKAGGKLCLYPDRTDELLSKIRATPDEGAYEIFLEEGQTLVMYGGIVPHALLPVAEDQSRIVSVLCYQAF
ncbi:MAG: hypothetical protein ACR2F2_13255 [Pyrinomonadaceae bacterium]